MRLQLLQTLQPGETTGLRADGKIFVVLLVIAIIFLAIATYLYLIDLRLRNIEKRRDS